MGDYKMASDLDFLNLNYGQFLPMPDRLAIALAAFHLERDLLLTAGVLDDVSHHGGAGHSGRTHRELALVVDQKDTVKSHRLPGFNSQEFDFQRIAGANTILFASCF